MTQKLALTTCAAPEGKTVVIEEAEGASTTHLAPATS